MFDTRIDSVCVQQWLSFVQHTLLPGQIKAEEKLREITSGRRRILRHFSFCYNTIEILSVMPFNTVIHKQTEVENGTS